MAILIQDSFSGADGTLITAHSPGVGGAWSVSYVPGTPILQSSQCKGVVLGNVIVTNSTSTTESGIYVQARRYGSGEFGLYFGDPSLEGLAVTSDTQFNLAGLVGSHTATPGDLWRLELIGGTLYAYKNGVFLLSNASTTTGTKTFSFTVGSTTTAADDFEAGTIVPPAAPTLLTATCSTGIGEPLLPDVPRSFFTADVTSGLAPLTVQFTDGSTNNPTSWLWEDETGTFSTIQNPTRVFAEGIHTVRLTATNAQGTGSPYQMTIIAYATPPVVPPDGGTLTPSGSIPGQTIQGLFGKIGYYAVDTDNNQIKIHDPAGAVLKTFGGVGTAVGKFFRPTTVAVINGRQLLDRVVIPEE